MAAIAIPAPRLPRMRDAGNGMEPKQKVNRNQEERTWRSRIRVT